MLAHDEKGLRLADVDFWIDAHRKTPFSFVSHGHTDHLKNHTKILATPATVDFHAIRARQREAILLELNKKYQIDDYEIELFPAGHILGSAMIRVVKNGTSFLYTGDFKMKKSWTAEPIEIPSADVLVMESTFGKPEYAVPHEPEYLVNQIVSFIEDCFAKGYTPIVLGYTLGKSQEAMKIIGDLGYTVKVQKTVWEFVSIYEKYGVSFNNCFLWNEESVDACDVLIIPPHAYSYKRVRFMPPRYKSLLLSGWANASNGFRFRAHEAVALSDHADFNELIKFVKIVNPQKIFTTHGFDDFPHYLKDEGFDAEMLHEGHLL